MINKLLSSLFLLLLTLQLHAACPPDFRSENEDSKPKKEIRQLQKEIKNLDKELGHIKVTEQKLAEEEEILKKKAWAEAGKRKKRRNTTTIRRKEQKILDKLTAKRIELAAVRSEKDKIQSNISRINNRIAHLSGETLITEKTISKPIIKAESKPSINSNNLNKEVKNWVGTPYRYGGTNKSGIDCSGLTTQIYKSVFNISLPRSSKDQYSQSNKIAKAKIKPGDLVFFKINKTVVSHVGIYLGDGNFIHASTSRGVVINNLSELYYKKYFIGGGRY
nr:NlpC/P60 family protein [uncultured Carboxylicivirga sp.]